MPANCPLFPPLPYAVRGEPERRGGRRVEALMERLQSIYTRDINTWKIRLAYAI
jgi:hypothetical protein